MMVQLFEMLIRMLYDGHKCTIGMGEGYLMQFKKVQEGDVSLCCMLLAILLDMPLGSRRFQRVKKVQEGSRWLKVQEDSVRKRPWR